MPSSFLPTVVGYYRNPEATKGAISEDGFMHTWVSRVLWTTQRANDRLVETHSGDIAEMDEEGFIYIKDRIKEIVNRGGEKSGL